MTAHPLIDDPIRGIFRVHRSVMTSPAIIKLERERIFDRHWIFAGHESMVPNPGDYLRRTIVGRPVFIVRGSDGQVRVFLNTCLHRGAMVCRRDAGNAETFQCFYHAWTYNNKGELIGIPDESGYAPGFDRAERALKAPPRLESYRGFCFISFNPEVEALGTYLADARLFLDILAEQGGRGARVIPGSLRYTIRANWKLLVENSMDGYHLPATHATYLQYMESIGIRQGRQDRESWGAALGNGHAAFGSPEGAQRQYRGEASSYSRQVEERIARLRERLAEHYGEQRAGWLPGRFNLFIYPNLVFVGTTTMRTFWPVAPDEVEVHTWVLVPGDDDTERLAQVINNYFIFQGPGGFATPDDVEALESCQLGFLAKPDEWSDISRGMHRVPQSNDELQMRAFWRQWYADLFGLPSTKGLSGDENAFAPRERVLASGST